MTEILLLLTELTLILSAIMVVTLNNYVLCTLSLILCFIAASVTLLLLKLEFIGLVIVIIYIGAVAVLFIFIILMIDIKRYLTISYFLLFSGILCFVLLLEISFLILSNLNLNPYYFYSNNFFLTDFIRNWIFEIDTSMDVKILGQILSIDFVIHLLASGLILFLGIISSVFLTFNFKAQRTKLQTTFRQLSKNFHRSLV